LDIIKNSIKYYIYIHILSMYYGQVNRLNDSVDFITFIIIKWHTSLATVINFNMKSATQPDQQLWNFQQSIHTLQYLCWVKNYVIYVISDLSLPTITL